jgi:hypothetical protein
MRHIKKKERREQRGKNTEEGREILRPFPDLVSKSKSPIKPIFGILEWETACYEPRGERSSLIMERTESYPLPPSKRAARALSSPLKRKAERSGKKLFFRPSIFLCRVVRRKF